MKPSTTRVFDALHRNDWVCGQVLAHPEVGGNRFGARLGELRGDLGLTIDKRICRNPRHRHVVTMWEYRIVEPSVQLTLEAVS